MSLVREIKQKQKGFDRQCAKINIRKKNARKQISAKMSIGP